MTSGGGSGCDVRQCGHRDGPGQYWALSPIEVHQTGPGALSLEIHPHAAGLSLLRVTAPEYDAEFEVWGDCPVQALGMVGGRDLYFRARSKGWSLDGADTDGHLPSDGYRESDGFYREGGYADAGWMPLQDAVAIIVRCLSEFRADRA